MARVSRRRGRRRRIGPAVRGAARSWRVGGRDARGFAGGSVYAAEQIRREVKALRDGGKPVVVSMGSVAASGGYWISMEADEIWAHENDDHRVIASSA